MPNPVYLDHNATTPIAAVVAEAMSEALREVYGNPSSSYPPGQAAAKTIADAAQAVGKLPVNVDDLGVDLLTVAGHKFQASKDIGALYVREGTPIRNVLFGAGHERGLRPGTENVPAIIGLGVAAQLASQRQASRDDRLRRHRDQLHERLHSAIPGLALNGHPEHRLPNTLNLSFPGVMGKALLAAASDTVLASVGSACQSAEEGPSGVLGGMGLSAHRANGAVRLSTGWETTTEDIELAAHGLIEACTQLTTD